MNAPGDQAAQWMMTIATHLIEQRLKVAVAESLTAGRVQQMLASRSGSSAFFAGGITTYAIAEKVRLLGVDSQMATACNAVSAEIAAQMASGVRRLFQCQVGIATTGYAEPSVEFQVTSPFAFVCVGWDHGELTERISFHGDREQAQQRCAWAAMRMLHQWVNDQSS